MLLVSQTRRAADFVKNRKALVNKVNIAPDSKHKEAQRRLERMRNGDSIICSECERLWSHCERTAQQHRTLLARLKATTAPADKAGAVSLIQRINEADLARRKAQEALEAHQFSTGHH